MSPNSLNGPDHELLNKLLSIRREGMSGKSPAVERYQQELALFYNADHAIAVSSGGAAVTVSCSVLQLQPGDTVIVPPSAPICTVHAIQFAGAEPIFCDTRSDSFGLDPQSVMEAVLPSTKAIFEVPMYCYPTEIHQMSMVARKLKLPFILDAAHSHHTRLNGRWLSEYADIACFSTHSSKLMPTGEGGFILTNRRDFAETMLGYRQFGDFDGVRFGLNFKMSGLQATVGSAALRDLPADVVERQSVRRQILSRLRNLNLRELPIPRGGEVPGYYLVLQELNGEGRALCNYQVQHGIPSEIAKYDSKCLYECESLREYRSSCLNAEALLASITTVPIPKSHDTLTVDGIVDALNSYRPKS
jgi:perosamine synthetase